MEIKRKRNGLSIIVALHVLAVLMGLPIVYRDYYYDILDVKYYYYCGCVITMLVAMLIYGCVKMIQKKKRSESKTWTSKNLKIRELFSFADVMLIVFLTVAAISTALSPFKFEAFWGNEGRFSGLFLLMLYTAAYFCIVKCFRMRPWYIDLCLISGLAVCIFGLTDFFNLDLLGFEEFLTSKERNGFTSFIGNINMYTQLLVIYLGMVAFLWIGNKNKLRSLWYYICLWIIYLACITGESDNVYLSVGALFAVLPLYAFRSRRGIRRYLILVTTFLASAKVVEWASIKYADMVVELRSIYNIIVGFSKLNIVIYGLCGLIAVIYIVDYVSKKQDAEITPWLWRGWLAVIVTIALAVVYVLYDVNIAGHGEAYGSVAKYLKFTDSWGSSRGYIWRIALENYKKFPLLQKLFGHGPDTFGLITYFNNLSEMTEVYRVLFENAHNEYLQYLMTTGLFGALAYIVFLIGVFARTIRRQFNNIWVMAMLTGVFCYVSQAVVNISQPIVTPVMWTLLAMCLAGCRKIDTEAEDSRKLQIKEDQIQKEA